MIVISNYSIETGYSLPVIIALNLMAGSVFFIVAIRQSLARERHENTDRQRKVGVLG